MRGRVSRRKTKDLDGLGRIVFPAQNRPRTRSAALILSPRDVAGPRRIPHNDVKCDKEAALMNRFGFDDALWEAAKDEGKAILSGYARREKTVPYSEFVREIHLPRASLASASA